MHLSGQTIAVTGATGRLGQAVMPALAQTGAQLRAIVRRTPDHPLSADIRAAALTDPEALKAAVTGADQLVAILPDVPDIPAMMATLSEAARAAGLRRIVKISAHLASQAPPESFGIEHAQADTIAQDSGIETVIFRPAMFIQSLALFFSGVARGKLIAPVKTGKVAFIDTSDIAAAIVAALSGDVPAGIHMLTGPQSLSFSDVADALSDRAGMRIKHIAPPLWLAGLLMRTDTSMNAFTRQRLLNLLRALEAGKEAPVMPDLTTILGRPGLTLAQRLTQAGSGAVPDLTLPLAKEPNS